MNTKQINKIMELLNELDGYGLVMTNDEEIRERLTEITIHLEAI